MMMMMVMIMMMMMMTLMMMMMMMMMMMDLSLKKVFPLGVGPDGVPRDTSPRSQARRSVGGDDDDDDDDDDDVISCHKLLRTAGLTLGVDSPPCSCLRGERE
jgi:hypothetical protein